MLKVLLAASLSLALAACGGDDGGSPTTGSATSPPPSSGGNAPPSIQGQPGTSVLAGQTYTFQPTASDPNGDQLTFTATNLPAWLSLNASTGRLTGTPTVSDLGTYSEITVSVSDGTASASLPGFSITVTNVASGSATLSWTPPTQNSDGSALTNLAGYRVMYGLSSTDLNQVVAVDNPSLSTYVVENLTSGTWYFAVVAVNSSGATSPLSNLASKTIS